jgi:hypothetical protein
MTTPTTRLRWFQYSLRTLLVFVTLCAIACSWLAVKIKQARQQREVVAEVEKSDGWIYYDWQVDAKPTHQCYPD